MATSLSLSFYAYRLLTRILAPAAQIILKRRASSGKEAPERVPERLGVASQERPSGRLVWLHGASVGETALLLDLWKALKSQHPDLSALFTSQTLTSADLFKRAVPSDAIHQMAPVDTPQYVRKFIKHWAPNLGIFAEGEIWPNLLTEAQTNDVQMALINARMTAKSLEGWAKRKALAAKLFNGFKFIGAADHQTARGIEALTGREVATVGNLKQAASPPSSDPLIVSDWKKKLGNRPIVLAASTHEGEEELAIQAFQILVTDYQNALLILAPRHPARADRVAHELKFAGLTFKQLSVEPQPGCSQPVLLADTMGDMPLWLALADGIYLGGANKPDVGGHNPMEAMKLEKPIFTGPHFYNFSDLMPSFIDAQAATIGETAEELSSYWRNCLSGQLPPPDWNAVADIFKSVEAPMNQTLDALNCLLHDGDRINA